MNQKRWKIIKEGEKNSGSVAYWMSRDQRVEDNWPLLFSQELAIEEKSPLAVIFSLVPDFPGANIRHYAFMLKGLKEVEKNLREKNIPFYLLMGEPQKKIPDFTDKYNISALVTDFDPTKIKVNWKKALEGKISIPFYEVDGRNIVPCRIASEKKEYGAYTLRPKIHRLLPEFLEEFSELKSHPFSWQYEKEPEKWERIIKEIPADRTVPEVNWLKPGEEAAKEVLFDFLKNKLSLYVSKKNDPTEDVLSNLSPYLHFGQISAQRVALEVQKIPGNLKSEEAFLEELIVRRELSDNFCFYEKNYDSFEGFPEWAKKTLNEHRKDKREYIYSPETFEGAKTHDELWNSAQREMVKKGRMHGYMRMYWAKKILEWTEKPEDALKIAIYLNDKYELDGRDSNGYTGIAWSVGGVHDRAWKERSIYGKIRYMSYNGCKSKFDVKKYMEKFNLPDY